MYLYFELLASGVLYTIPLVLFLNWQIFFSNYPFCIIFLFQISDDVRCCFSFHIECHLSRKMVRHLLSAPLQKYQKKSQNYHSSDMDHCVPSGVTRNHLCRAASFSATPVHRLIDLLSPQLALNVQSSGVPGTYDGTDVPASIDPHDCDVQHDCSCTVDRQNPRGYRVGWVHVFHHTDKIPGAIESGGYIIFIILTKSLVLSSRVGTCTCFSSD